MKLMADSVYVLLSGDSDTSGSVLLSVDSDTSGSVSICPSVRFNPAKLM